LPLAVRVGVASGLVVVGDIIGQGASEEAAVAGETPNLAARMQGLAEPNQLVLPDATRKLLKDAFTLESIGLHTLKGFPGPQEAFRVSGTKSRERRFQPYGISASLPLLGREESVQQLKDDWRDAKSGSGKLIVINGEAGIGKSRLVQELIDAIEQDSGKRITYQCSPFHTDSAYYPVIHQIQLSGNLISQQSDDQRLARLKTLPGITDHNLPFVANMLTIDSQAGYQLPDLAPELIRSKTHEALIEVLAHQADSQPLLVVFEDLHWIDPSSLEFLSLLGRSINERRVLVVATARPEFSHPLANENGSGSTISLSRLDDSHARSIVNRLTDGDAVPERLLKLIIERTDGVPLYIEEFTKAVLERDVLESKGSPDKRDNAGQAAAIPATLHDSLMARLDRLQPIKEVAQIASCIGREFSHELLCRLVSLSETRLNLALAELVDAELVYRAESTAELRYQFKHALVRDAAYESLLKPRRREVHCSILQVLQENDQTPVDLLATHAEAAGLADKAIPLWVQASKKAVSRRSLDEAISHLENAIRLNEPLTTQESERYQLSLKLHLQLGLVVAPRFGWGAEETKSVFERALAVSAHCEDKADQYTVEYGLVCTLVTRAEYSEAVDAGRRLLKLAESAEDSTKTIVAHRAIGMAMMPRGELRQSQRHFEKCLELYNPEQHSGLAEKFGIDLGVACYSLCANNCLLMGESVRAFEYADKLRQIANQCEDLNSVCYMHASYSALMIIEQNDRGLLTACTALTELANEHNLAGWRNWSDMFRGLLQISKGDIGGVELYRKGENAQVESSQLYRLGTSRISAAHRLYAIGEYQMAEQFAVETEALIERTGEASITPGLYNLLAKIAMQRGDKQTSENRFIEAIGVSDQHDNRLWELRNALDYADLLIVQKRVDELSALLKRACGKIKTGNCIVEMERAGNLAAKSGIEINRSFLGV